ncbi:MAG: S-layer homology domain-containing protein, partial [Clostridia bacterium]|nr:S-layer homology domain-containing protein [Clostridia bacterium]
AIYPYKIEKTMTVMAYTYNTETGRYSETVSQSYVVMGESALGAISIKWPFSQNRISAHKLGKGEYATGIQFIPETDVYYEYAYTLTKEAGGGTYKSDTIMYDEKAAFVPTERIDYMTITAWINGDKNNTVFTHPIDFVHLDIPVTDLPEQAEYEKNTAYHIVNKYKDDPTIIVYYTTNNSDPTIDSADRKSFTMSELGPEEKLTQTTTVKAVYFSACGKTTGEEKCTACSIADYKNCPDYVYGEIGEYKYPVPTKTTVTVGGGGGGGGGTIDKTRKYTNDIFGNEHPTHIGYINGYPDGSVKPEGDITREEITSILYRITNHQYEKPFVATGDAFPDVEVSRWSAHDIEYMADKEIVYGYPDGEFKPSRNLSRAEFAALIFRFTGIEKADIENLFSDFDNTHWAYDEILALTNSGLIEGYPDKTYKPENNITRAEVMTVINKLLGRKPLESYVKSLDFNPYNDLYEDKWYYVTVLEATVTHNYWLDNKGYEYKWEDWK